MSFLIGGSLKDKANYLLKRFDKISVGNLTEEEMKERRKMMTSSDFIKDCLTDDSIPEKLANGEDIYTKKEHKMMEKVEKEVAKEQVKEEKKAAKEEKKKEKEAAKNEKKEVKKEEKDAIKAIKAIPNSKEFSSNVHAFVNKSKDSMLDYVALSEAAVKGARLTHYVLEFCSNPDFKLITTPMTSFEKQLCNGISEMIGFGVMYDEASTADLSSYDVSSDMFLGIKALYIIDTEDIKATTSTPDFIRRMKEKRDIFDASKEHPEDDVPDEETKINLNDTIRPFMFSGECVINPEDGTWKMKDSSSEDAEKETVENDKKNKDVKRPEEFTAEDVVNEIRESNTLQSIIGYKIEPEHAFVNPRFGCPCVYIRHASGIMEDYRIDIGPDNKLYVLIHLEQVADGMKLMKRVDPTTGGEQYAYCVSVPIDSPIGKKALTIDNFRLPENQVPDYAFVWWDTNKQ